MFVSNSTSQLMTWPAGLGRGRGEIERSSPGAQRTPAEFARAPETPRQLPVCDSPACAQFAQQTQTAWQELVRVEPARCACCGGSHERRALNSLVPVLLRRRIYRLLLVGASPELVATLQRYLRPLGLHIVTTLDPRLPTAEELAWAHHVVSASRLYRPLYTPRHTLVAETCETTALCAMLQHDLECVALPA